MYVTSDKYRTLYTAVDEGVFNRFYYDACKYVDKYTTGVDGIKKLQTYFPKEANAVEAVERCTAEIINTLLQIHEAEMSAAAGRGYTQTANGMQGKIVSSVSAGNESISYAALSNQATLVDAAVNDIAARDSLIRSIIRKHLSGETDANGVNLLYMGVYPCV